MKYEFLNMKSMFPIFGAQKYIPFSKLQLIKASYLKLVPFPFLHPVLYAFYRKKSDVGGLRFIFACNSVSDTSFYLILL